MMIHERYAKAVVALLKKGHDSQLILDSLRALLIKKNHLTLAPGVAASCERQLKRTENLTQDVLFVAREEDALSAQTKFPASVVRVDPTLIGGTRRVFNGRLVDASHKHKLLTLYRSITN